MTPAEMDRLFDGALVEFEKWFVSRQVAAGRPAAGLIGVERGVIKAYLLYLSTEKRNVSDTNDQ